MATTKRTIHDLRSKGGERVASDLKKVGKSGERAFNLLNKGSRRASQGMRQVDQGARRMRGAMETAAARGNPLLTGLTALGPAGIGAAAGITAAALAARKFVSDGIKFEQSLANLSAITGATGQDLAFFKEQALEIGRTTSLSASQAVEAFKLVGSAKPELLESAAALASVAEQAVVLAEAAGLVLPDAVRALTTTLNQFRLDGTEAARVVNVLAAGSKFGAAEVPALTIAMQKSGTAAKQAGLSVEQTVGALETLAAFGGPAEEFGTQFRNVLIAMQKGMGDVVLEGGNLSEVLNQLAADQISFGDAVDLVGKRNAAALVQLIGVRDVYAEMTEKVSDTNTAMEQQATNMDTLRGDLLRLTSAWEAFGLTLTNSTNPALRSVVQLATQAVNKLNELNSAPVPIASLNQGQLEQEYVDLFDEILAKEKELAHAKDSTAHSQEDVNVLELELLTLKTRQEAAEAKIIQNQRIAIKGAQDRARHEERIAEEKAKAASAEAHFSAVESARRAGLTEEARKVEDINKEYEERAKHIRETVQGEKELGEALAANERERLIKVTEATKKSGAARRKESDKTTRHILANEKRIQKLRDEVALIGLEVEDELREERDQALAEWERNETATAEQIAEAKLLIEKKYQKKKAAEEDKARKKREEKEKKAVEEMRKNQAERAAEEQERLAAPFVNAAADAQQAFSAAFASIFQEGELSLEQLGRSIVAALAQAAAQTVALKFFGGLGDAFLGSGGVGSLAGDFGGHIRMFGSSISSFAESVTGFGDGVTSLAEQGVFGPTPSGGNIDTGAGVVSGLGSAVGTMGIALAVLSAFEGAEMISAASQNRKSFFTDDDAIKFAEANAGAINGLLGEIIPFESLGKSTRNTLDGSATIADVGKAAILAFFTLGLGTALVGASTPPTAGTALRKNFEEFIEGEGPDDKLPNIFDRGIAQKATRAILKERFGTDKGVPEGAFEAAMREVIGAAQDRFEFSERERKEINALGVAFRAIVGAKAGHEHVRSIASIGDLLLSMEEHAFTAAQALDVVREGIRDLGGAPQIFQELNEFFTSEKNDIRVHDYMDAVQGLASVLFSDLPAGANAAREALRLYAEDGLVEFEELEDAIEKVVGAATVSGDELRALFGGFGGAGGAFRRRTADFEELADTFATNVLKVLRDGLSEAFFQTAMDQVFTAGPIGDFTAASGDIIQDWVDGTITADQAVAMLNKGVTAILDNSDEYVNIIRALRDSAEALDQVFHQLTEEEQSEVRGDFAEQAERELLELQDPRAAAIEAEEEALEKRLEALEELEFAEEEHAKVEANIREAHRLRLLDIDRQYNDAEAGLAEDRLAAIEGLRDVVREFTITDANPLGAVAALAGAEDEFDALLRRAQSGDVEALQELPDAFRNAFGLFQEVYGSGAPAMRFYEDGLEAMNRIIDSEEARAAAEEARPVTGQASDPTHVTMADPAVPLTVTDDVLAAQIESLRTVQEFQGERLAEDLQDLVDVNRQQLEQAQQLVSALTKDVVRPDPKKSAPV